MTPPNKVSTALTRSDLYGDLYLVAFILSGSRYALKPSTFVAYDALDKEKAVILTGF